MSRDVGTDSAEMVRHYWPVALRTAAALDGWISGDLSDDVRNEDFGVQLTEQLDAPDPREVDQGCGVADRLQGPPSDAISSSSSAAVVWIVGIW